MADGYHLPVSRWQRPGNDTAIVLALHGLNDYRHGFQSTGEYLADNGIIVLAYDQRGFGETDGHGLWHGTDRMVEDLREMIDLLHGMYPGMPLYLVGESMGGAIVLAAMHEGVLAVNGIVLLAPAVWSRARMPFYQRWALWLAAHTMPSRTLTGEGLDLHPSDNIEMLHALGRDSLVIKATRIDVLYGIANLMDRAVSGANETVARTLVLYGMKDDIIPHGATCEWLQSLPPDDGHWRQILIYQDGYHMLTRDLQAEIVLKDMLEWMNGSDGYIVSHDGLIPPGSFCQ